MFSDSQTRPKQPNPNNPKPKSHQPQTSPYWLSDQLGKCWALQDRACVNRRRGSMPRGASSSPLFAGNPFHSRKELTGSSPEHWPPSATALAHAMHQFYLKRPHLRLTSYKNPPLDEFDSWWLPTNPAGAKPSAHSLTLPTSQHKHLLFCSVTQQLCLGWKTVLLILLKEIQCCGRAPCLSACGAGYRLL